MKENAILRYGSFCILIGGAVTNLISLFNGAAAMLAMSALDESTLNSLNEYAKRESEGMFGSSEAIGAANAVAVVVIAFSVVGLAVSAIVGAMGISRSKIPQKYTFFLGWGIVLLVTGLFGIGQVFSLRGIFAMVGGVIGPAMYIVGGIQQNKAANSEISSEE